VGVDKGGNLVLNEGVGKLAKSFEQNYVFDVFFDGVGVLGGNKSSSKNLFQASSESIYLETVNLRISANVSFF